MAGAKSQAEKDYFSKKGGDDIPVEACKGWFDPCDFCDKRFSEWVPVDDDVWGKIPDMAGFFMIALKNKNIIEVVSIIFNKTNIQKPAYSTIDSIREQISNKKSKATKSSIFVRWMVLKKGDDKDVCTLCAHWQNTGVLPKFLTTWPGINLLEKSEHFVFSEDLKKWCYPKKNPVWRKPKPQPSKISEIVKKCDWCKPCETCDSYFSAWKSVTDVVYDNLAPDELGLYVVSVSYGKNREVVFIGYDEKNIVLSIRSSIKNRHKWLESILKNNKFVNKNATVELRWILLKDTDSENACFLYSHWLNVGTIPLLNFSLPGEQILDKNKHFVFRTNDKNWYYETNILKPSKSNKEKSKKHLYEGLENDDYYE